MDSIVVYVTFPDEMNAKKMVRYLLEKHLIACGNVSSIQSLYWWKGKIEEGPETVAILKTRKEHWEAVKREIEAAHTYETPCILKFEMEANEAFAKFIQAETNEVI